MISNKGLEGKSLKLLKTRRSTNNNITAHIKPVTTYKSTSSEQATRSNTGQACYQYIQESAKFDATKRANQPLRQTHTTTRSTGSATRGVTSRHVV